MLSWTNIPRQLLPAIFLCAALIAGKVHPLKAQILGDTLKNVDIRSNKKQHLGSESKIQRYVPGQKIITLDSATLQQYHQQSLATMLAQQVPVFVKSYGFNSMATLSFRGASAAQSMVLWEGIPLQNAASGIADVSLMPVALLDDVRAVYGSSAALLGSGNVGGAVLIESKSSDFKKSSSGALTLGGGSFHQLQLGVKGDIASKRWTASIRLFAQNARNNFTYRDEAGRKLHMTNDSLGSRSALLRIAYQVNEFNTLSVQSWVQQYFRQIPPALFESYSVKNQVDDAQRFVFNWQHNKKQSWYLKTAYLHDQLRYTDPAINLESKSSTSHLFAEGGWEKTFRPWQRLLLFVPVQLLSFDGTADHQQLKIAIAGAYHHSFMKQKLNTAVNVRAEVINGKGIFLAGANGSYNAKPWLKILANVQRTYRNPTLNELYYNPGGNKDLKPEEGWHLDAGYSIHATAGKQVYFEHNGSAFDRRIKNWIIWLGGSIWTPHNLAAVHSRGLETENKLVIDAGQLHWSVSVNGAYTKSTSTKSYLANDNSIGKQIPYTPEWSGQLNAVLNWKWFELSYNHTFTGYRYITSDESQYLEPFQTGSLRAAYTFTRSAFKVRLDAQCQNIFDQQYAVIGFRPMPGRNWLVGATFFLKGRE